MNSDITLALVMSYVIGLINIYYRVGKITYIATKNEKRKTRINEIGCVILKYKSKRSKRFLYLLNESNLI